MNATDKERRRMKRLAKVESRQNSQRAPAPLSPSYPLNTGLTATPVQEAPVVEKKPDTVEIRTAAVSMVLPYQVYAGRLQHPDPIVRQFGFHYGVAFYRLMMQQNLSLSADCQQWEDRINAIDMRIKPGAPDDDTSKQMAKDAKRVFSRLSATHIVNTWIVRCRWYGVTSIGKAGWKKDSGTGLLAPFDLYNIDPWRWKFGPNFEPYLLTQSDPYYGKPIPTRSVFFSRWGSNFTAYGESDLRDVYLSQWYVQNVTTMLVQSIEILGRPIPWIEVGDSLQGPEFDDFEARIALQYKYYVITRTPEAKTSTTFPNLNVLANGNVGKSELDFVRYHDSMVQRKILGTAQTQDKTGGSRALESTRMEIAGDKTPPAARLRDQVWTEGYLDDIGLVNWPDQPREMWPVMDSEASSIGKDRLTGPQVLALMAVAEKLRLNQMTDTFATEMLVMTDIERGRAEDMVASMIDPESGLSKDMPVPALPPVPTPGASNTAAHAFMRQVACEDGKVLTFDTRIPIGTSRGDIAWPLASGDEITTIRRMQEAAEIEEMMTMKGDA